MWYLCKEIYKTTPDDPRITEMDPVQKTWMFNNWIADQNDSVELAKNHAYLLASFSNPEAVEKIVGGGNSHMSTDDEFEETSKMVQEQSFKLFEEEVSQPIKKRRKRELLK
jgi:hypothetical protein